MALGKFRKTPDEAKRYSIEYSDWLDAGEYLSNATITFTPSNPVNPMLVDIDMIPENGTALSFFVFGGDAGVTYKLLVRATTTTLQVKEDIVAIEVKSL